LLGTRGLALLDQHDSRERKMRFKNQLFE
jgi:hypothetical protein